MRLCRVDRADRSVIIPPLKADFRPLRNMRLVIRVGVLVVSTSGNIDVTSVKHPPLFFLLHISTGLNHATSDSVSILRGNLIPDQLSITSFLRACSSSELRGDNRVDERSNESERKSSRRYANTATDPPR